MSYGNDAGKPFVFFDDMNCNPPQWCAALNDADETYVDFNTWREAFDFAHRQGLASSSGLDA